MELIREIECYLDDSDELICAIELTEFSLEEARYEWEIDGDKMMYNTYEIKSKKQKELIQKHTKGITINFYLKRTIP